MTFIDEQARYSQEPRLIDVSTPLGEDVLLLLSFSGREEVSRLFSYSLVTASQRDDIAPDELVGKNITFALELNDTDPLRQAPERRTRETAPSAERKRYFNGYVSRLVAGPKEVRNLRRYVLEVVPWTWFLTRTADCRIFQEMTVEKIIERIFTDLGFNDFRFQLNGSYSPREYCVQYRETDFDFVSRLCEEEGMYYFFLHEEGRHEMVIADNKQAYQDAIEREIRYSPGTLIPDHITSWDHGYEFRPGKWAQTDYNFKKPSTSLMTNTNTTVQLPSNQSYEIYDYPGEYKVKGDGEQLTLVRMEEEESAYDNAHAESGCRTLNPAHKFLLVDHDSANEENIEYVVTAIDHAAHSGTYTTEETGNEYYRNSFACMPSAATFRPARVTPKPTIKGPQTAVVVGPSGEEIYTDEYGRIKVQFHWDREGNKDENSSCWIRVRQDISGAKWGAVYLPRIGQEVIVEFLEGDPDRPLVTGCVYNAEQMPPWELPRYKNRSGYESRSTKDGSKSNANMIGFDDTKGEETLVLHAEKDAFREVENDDHVLVENDQKINIKNNRDAVIERGHETLTVKTGNRTTHIKLGKDYTEAMQSIELKVGQSSIKLTPTDITLKALNIYVKGQIITEVTGTMTTVRGSAVLTLQGGIVKLN